ncbi:MAG: mycofactocin biosynthesis chaperone MftB [Marmoricola sp.]
MPARMLGEAWRLRGSVALRPEPFGALAYDYDTRRLSFLKSARLVEVVRRLDGEHTVADALDQAGVAADERTRYLHALESLAERGMLVTAAVGAGR